MYNSKIFSSDDKNIIELIENYPFCSLVSSDLKVTHLPMLIYSGDISNLVLIGHMMTSSDHYEAFNLNSNGLLIFLAEQAYISSKNYNNQKTASTWNYTSVTCYGDVEFLDDQGTLESIKLLTRKMESKDSNNLVEDMDPRYVESNLKHIRGFYFKVNKINSVFKMSQNKTKEEREKIISDLNSQGKISVANAIKKYS